MIKYLDINEVPEKIGEAEIVFEPWKKKTDYYDRSVQVLPRRQDKTIILPEEKETKFYSLLKGEQFLFTTRGDDGRKLFFGGMDESPFLVELQYHLIEKLMEGEQSFFNALKPPAVKSWEDKIGTRAKRQGDFFAVSPKKKTDFVTFFKERLANYTFRLSVVENFSLRDTRHRLNGLVAVRENGNEMIGEGVITAPDHEPLFLNGPHLIEQAFGFVRPREAD